ncbi:unnamed protein product [Phytomonas sp. Hart1]|nr:unnamed protein product [Phytomonas sp. Hart1]|eukprot:CCW70683.1 unnamed protein product [Phytomonas sp. isolate Hart1]
MISSLSIYFLGGLVGLLCLFSPPVRAISLHHGAEWRHLDCSACLTVAMVLEERMANSLKFGPTSYLLHHRIAENSTIHRPRRDFRTSEARAFEVLEVLCREKFYYPYPLRLNPKTKVRGYHLRSYGDLRRSNYSELREKDRFPPGMDLRQLNLVDQVIYLSLAQLYTTREVRELSAITLNAPEQFCVRLMEDHEEALEEIVRYADGLTELEALLCGLKWRERKDLASTSRGVLRRFREPLTRVCEDVAALRSAAALDQRCWEAWDRHTRHRTQTAPKEGKEAFNQTSNATISSDLNNVNEGLNDDNALQKAEAESVMSHVYDEDKDL